MQRNAVDNVAWTKRPEHDDSKQRAPELLSKDLLKKRMGELHVLLADTETTERGGNANTQNSIMPNQSKDTKIAQKPHGKFSVKEEIRRALLRVGVGIIDHIMDVSMIMNVDVARKNVLHLLLKIDNRRGTGNLKCLLVDSIMSRNRQEWKNIVEIKMTNDVDDTTGLMTIENLPVHLDLGLREGDDELLSVNGNVTTLLKLRSTMDLLVSSRI